MNLYLKELLYGQTRYLIVHFSSKSKNNYWIVVVHLEDGLQI